MFKAAAKSLRKSTTVVVADFLTARHFYDTNAQKLNKEYLEILTGFNYDIEAGTLESRILWSDLLNQTIYEGIARM
jgi:hypothetical protein